MGAPKSPNNATCTFLNIVHLLPKVLRFEHEGVKFASCPGRYLTSLRPWTHELFPGPIKKTIVLSCSLYRSTPIICRLFDIHIVILLKCFHKKGLTGHDDVITPLLRGAPRLSVALGPAPARAGPSDFNANFL